MAACNTEKPQHITYLLTYLKSMIASENACD